MNKKDLLFVGAGIVVGYLLVGVINKNKVVSGATTDSTSLPDTSNQTVPPASADTTGTAPPIINQGRANLSNPETV